MSAPALSVVIASRSGWATVAGTLRALAAQTVADRLEVVLVALGGAPADAPPPEVARLAAHRVVPVAADASVAQANAAGARAASADVVALGEDHAFPLPDWAEALIARHAEPWAVVGPVVRNANPGTLVSWADFALGYSAYAEGQPGGEVETAPGHNSSYKRAVLQRHDADLEEALEAEWVFHLALRDEGERIYVEPRAVVRHVNFGALRPFLAVTLRHARVAAATRAAEWSWPKRIAYTLASPLIPPLRLTRILRGMPSQQRARFPKRALPLLATGLLADGAGQAAGFLLGVPSEQRGDLAQMELERVRFIPEEEAASLP